MSDGVFMHRVMNSDRAVGAGCHGYVPLSYCGAQTRQKSPPLNNVKKTSLSYCGGQKANSLTSVIIMYEIYQLVLRIWRISIVSIPKNCSVGESVKKGQWWRRLEGSPIAPSDPRSPLLLLLLEFPEARNVKKLILGQSTGFFGQFGHSCRE